VVLYQRKESVIVAGAPQGRATVSCGHTFRPPWKRGLCDLISWSIPLEIAFLLCHASQMSQPAEILNVTDMVARGKLVAEARPETRRYFDISATSSQ
jgi:hypothetical protein